jgi:hypothetical protein
VEEGTAELEGRASTPTAFATGHRWVGTGRAGGGEWSREGGRGCEGGYGGVGRQGKYSNGFCHWPQVGGDRGVGGSGGREKGEARGRRVAEQVGVGVCAIARGR